MTTPNTTSSRLILLPFLAGLVGGLCGVIIAQSGVAHAAQKYLTNLVIFSPDGKKGVQTFVQDGQPGIFFYGENGQPRLQMGTYSAASERGQPLFGMSDHTGKLRVLLRLAGPYSSPVLIMKDVTGKDILVMGIDPNNGTSPFLTVTDATGRKQRVFGSY